MSVTQVGTPGAASTQVGSNAGNITGAWSGTQPRTAGDLLVAVVTAWGATSVSVPLSTPAGWTQNSSISGTRGQAAIYTKVAAGTDAAPNFTATMTGTATFAECSCYLYELTGQDGGTPVATFGNGTGATSPLTIATGGNVPVAGCYAITSWLSALTAAAACTLTQGSGWTQAFTTGATANRSHPTSGFLANPASGSTLSEALTSTGTIQEIDGAIIVVQPPTSTAVAGGDTGSGADTATLAAAVAAADTAGGADTATVHAAVTGADTAAGADTATVGVPVTGADTGTGADTAAAAAALAGADTATAADTATVAVAVTGADAGSGADLARIGVSGSDTGTGADSAAAGPLVPAADTAAGADTASVAVITPPVFPRAPLGLEIDLNLAGWTDITAQANQGGDHSAVTITRGRPDEATQCNPGAAPLMLNNGDGRFSPRLAAGPYYGLLGRNTPVRISIPYGSTYLRMEDDQASSCSTPDAAALDITGTIDVRIDCAPSSYVTSVLAGKWAGSGQRSWLFALVGDGTLELCWSTDGTFGGLALAQSTAPVPLGRICMRAKLSASLNQVTFFTAPAGQLNGTYTQLGAAVAISPPSIFNSTAPVAVGASAQFTADDSAYSGLAGQVFEFQISNSAGTVVAHPVFDAQAAGAASFTDSHGLAWTVNGTAEISGRSYRYHGEVSSLPVQWDPAGHDVWTPVATAGLLRRVGQGQAPIDSSMKRGLLQQAGVLAPVAYWPCEDGQGSTQAASATGGPPMAVTGAADFAADSSFLCSAALPTMGGAAFRGAVPAYSDALATQSVIVRFLLSVPSGSAPPNNAVIARVHCTGTVRDLTCYYTTGGGLRLAGWAADGSNVFDTGGVSFAVLGEQLWVSMELQPVAPSFTHVQYSIVTLQPGQSSGLATTGTFVSAGPGNATDVQAGPGQNLAGVTIGHISVQSEWESLFALFHQLEAWAGETAGNRFSRLCRENGFAARIYGPPDVSVAMGTQSPDTLTSLLQECETADLGMIYEPRQALALGYITQAALLNQAPAVTLSYAAGVLDDMGWPTDDDQYSRNDWTVTRGSGAVSGSSFQAVLGDGSPMSISPPPGGIGDYSDTVTSNVEADSMLPDQAWWRVHLGTVDEERYPLITVDLANSALGATLTGQVRDADIGAYLAVPNPPAWLPPDTIRQLATGTAEVLGDFVWKISWNAVPESPYETGIYDDPAYGRADTSGSTLHTSASSSATTLSVSTTAGNLLWTVVAADCPFQIRIGGEVMTVTAVSGASSPQTFTVTRSVNGVVKAQAAGQDVRLYPTPVYAML